MGQPTLFDTAHQEAGSDDQDALVDVLAQELPHLEAIAGFPDADTDSVLRLASPPFYAPCPNPFVEDYLASESTKRGKKQKFSGPYRGELKAEGRHPVGLFHPYHTKAPPSLIRRLIDHYCPEDGVVLDVFAGSGMTGVAAREAGRDSVLVDLSPAATFIAGVNTTTYNSERLINTLKEVLQDVRHEWEWVYSTEDPEGRRSIANYFVWADVFDCPHCEYRFPFFPHGVEHHGNKVETLDEFPCPNCDRSLTVRSIDRVIDPETDRKLKKLVWVDADAGKRRRGYEPTSYDVDLAEELEEKEISYWYPTDRIDPEGYTAQLAQLGDKRITSVDRFFSRRNLLIVAAFWDRISDIEERRLRNACYASLTSIFTIISERQGYFGGGGGMSGNLYMPIVRMEKNVFQCLERKLRVISKAEEAKPSDIEPSWVSTQSATDLKQLPDECVDFIYTDPPFGGNIIYSEMNQLLESWLDVRMAGRQEAVVDETRDRDVDDYQDLLRLSFAECSRVLKPEGWINVEFHSAEPEVWSAMRNAINESGFQIEAAAVLRKGSTTILQDIRPGAVEDDLIVVARKPSTRHTASSERDTRGYDDVWRALAEHLKSLPRDVEAEPDVRRERGERALYSRMVAFHILRQQEVPYSATEFYDKLDEYFVQKDGCYFDSSELN